MKKRTDGIAALFVLPLLFGILLFYCFPFLATIKESFWSEDGFTGIYEYKKLFMSELKETVGFKLDQDGCVSQLVSEFMSTCGFYFPLNNDLVSYFWTLCHNRKEEGIYMVDFKGICGVK